ncbi:unnamed protein product, partial [Choristocarpus tenellus]
KRGGGGVQAKQGVSDLAKKPATAFLLGVNLAVAYYLWAYRVSLESVAISYIGFWESKEYWRVLTASFSHFEVMHLAFNSISLWNLGELEPMLGSFGYLYLSFDLVVTTIVLVVLAQHALTRRGGGGGGGPRGLEGDSKAVGYSCVLFALMTLASVAQQRFCPLPFFPNFCFSTWFLPTPVNGWKLAVNLGPFALLFLVQFVIPRAGFLG